MPRSRRVRLKAGSAATRVGHGSPPQAPFRQGRVAIAVTERPGAALLRTIRCRVARVRTEGAVVHADQPARKHDGRRVGSARSPARERLDGKRGSPPRARGVKGGDRT